MRESFSSAARLNDYDVFTKLLRRESRITASYEFIQFSILVARLRSKDFAETSGFAAIFYISGDYHPFIFL